MPKPPIPPHQKLTTIDIPTPEFIKYVFHSPELGSYLQYDNRKQKFSNCFLIEQAIVIVTDGTKAHLQERVDKIYKRHFQQRSLLKQFTLLPVAEEMIRKVTILKEPEPIDVKDLVS